MTSRQVECGSIHSDKNRKEKFESHGRWSTRNTKNTLHSKACHLFLMAIQKGRPRGTKKQTTKMEITVLTMSLNTHNSRLARGEQE